MSPEEREPALGRPSGVVTLLFTDIEGSTRLLNTLTPEDSLAAFDLHGRVLREVFRRHGGYEQRTEGDSFFVVFQEAADAVAAAADAQRTLAAQNWPGGRPVAVRMGIHTGEPTPVAGDYVGLDVHRAARIASAGHGGQVLLSSVTRAAAALPRGASLRDLGEHRLKDLARPEWIFQLEIEGLDGDFPPLNSLETPSNLPADVTPLVGRDADVAAVVELLGSEHVRMVTITGPGGSGKTRLALAAAHRLGGAFRNGLVLVDLTTVTEPSKVAGAIELALDLPSMPEAPAVENVATQLRDRAVLLVLDNFEHVAAAAGDVARLLGGARRVKTIVTSRSALRIAAEREYPLQPLDQDAALALFVDRARAVHPAFDPVGPDADVVRDICARLDRLPLGIELAAAGVRLLSVEQIRDRLARRLPLPSGVRRDVPARQQTLRDAIAWSFDLLSPEEAGLLCRAAVFVGGFTLEAVEGVSAGDGDPVAGVATLVAQSLLHHDLDTGRFSMLETIREFALEEARERGLLAEANQRHAAFFASVAEQAEGGTRDADQAVRVRFDDDLPNLRAALLWALGTEPPQAQLAATVAVALGQHWYVHGRAVEGAVLLRRVHALDGVPLALRAQVAQKLGVLLDQQADKAGATEVLEQALGLFRQIGDRAGQARALNSLGSASRTVGSTQRARDLFEQSLRLRVELDDRAGISVTTFNLGQLAMDDGDVETARRLFERSQDIDASLGDEWGAMIGSLGVAAAAVAQGDLEAAPPRLAETVRFFLGSEDDDHLAEALSVCASEACARRLHERSARLLGAVEGLWEGLGFSLSPVDDVYVESCRSAVRAAMGEEAFERARAEGRAMTADQAVAFVLEGYDARAAGRAGVRP